MMTRKPSGGEIVLELTDEQYWQYEQLRQPRAAFPTRKKPGDSVGRIG
jgi:hypothetical protein